MVPIGVAAVNDRTHTVYVTNNADGDSPGTVSVINAATCNGTDTTGCHRHFPTLPTGNSPLLIAVDTRTGIVYVTNFSSASVTILDAARCNATTSPAAAVRPPASRPVGSQPTGLAINPRTRTVYVANLFQSGSLSIFRVTRH